MSGPEGEGIPILDWTYWRERGGASEWRRRLDVVEDVRDVQRLRRATYAGAPFGPLGFVEIMEERFGRQWLASGHPRKAAGMEEKGTERIGSVATG